MGNSHNASRITLSPTGNGSRSPLGEFSHPAQAALAKGSFLQVASEHLQGPGLGTGVHWAPGATDAVTPQTTVRQACAQKSMRSAGPRAAFTRPEAQGPGICVLSSSWSNSEGPSAVIGGGESRVPDCAGGVCGEAQQESLAPSRSKKCQGLPPPLPSQEWRRPRRSPGMAEAVGRPVAPSPAPLRWAGASCCPRGGRDLPGRSRGRPSVAPAKGWGHRRTSEEQGPPAGVNLLAPEAKRPLQDAELGGLLYQHVAASGFWTGSSPGGFPF